MTFKGALTSGIPIWTLMAMYMWPDYSAKVAATFGALRWSGLMLASVISGMLVKFGGTALAMLAGTISAMPQSSGAAYSSVLKRAGGVLQSEIIPTQTWANTTVAVGGVNNLARGLVQNGAGQMAGNAMIGNYFGTERIANATYMSGSSSIALAERQESVLQRLQGIGLSRDNALKLGATLGWNLNPITAFMKANQVGFLGQGSLDERIDKFQQLAPKVDGVDSETLALKIDRATVHTDTRLNSSGGLGQIVGVDLGQLDVKSAATQIADRTIQATNAKTLQENYRKMIGKQISDSASTGIDNTTAEDFTKTVSKRTAQELSQNKSFKDTIKSESEQIVFAELSLGGKVLETIGIKGGWRMQVRTSQGQILEKDVSDSFKRSYDQAEQNAIRQTVSQFARNEHRVQALRDWAMSSDAQEMKNFIEAVSYKEAFQSSNNLQENVQFVHFVGRQIGINTRDINEFNSVAKAITELASSDKLEDKKLLNTYLQSFVSNRFFAEEMSQIANTVDNQKQSIDFTVGSRKDEVTQMTKSGVPTVTSNTGVPKVDASDFFEQQKNVELGLNNKQKEMTFLLTPFSGPVNAAFYNWGYSFRKFFFPGADIKWRSHEGSLLQTPEEIFLKPQKPVDLSIRRDDYMPYPMVSPQEQDRRSERIRELMKQRVSEN